MQNTDLSRLSGRMKDILGLESDPVAVYLAGEGAEPQHWCNQGSNWGVYPSPMRIGQSRPVPMIWSAQDRAPTQPAQSVFVRILFRLGHSRKHENIRRRLVAEVLQLVSRTGWQVGHLPGM